jgi:arylsulfatase
MDALAAGGVRYTDFHVTGLCSTTRASLLTGRNHHSVGVGFLADYDTGYPSYRGAVSVQAATIAEVLRDHGYATYACGKWHLTPPTQMSAAGPFHQWPTQRGFDRYYGFLWGEDDQWSPELWYDQHRVDPPATADYHLSEDLVGRAKEFLSDHLSATPERPFFLYLAFGACHAPHQAPQSYRDKYRGAYAHGWDEERRRVLARQIEMGVVPEGTALAPRNPGVRPWDELPAGQRRLYARMQEVFAGFMEHTDTQIGALVAFLRRYGLLDNTMILVMSDNGASGEGGEHGSANEYRYFLGLDDRLEDSLAAIDELGSPATHNHYPAGWAQAGNTPLKFYKKYTYGGGVRAPLIVHWPGGVDPAQPYRRQVHHVIDIAPTVYEVAGATAPQIYRGVEQLPLHGVSMAYTFGEPSAPTRRGSQYFETAGYRGIIVGDWKAVAAHDPGTPFEADRWELFHLPSDFSETVDLSSKEPELAARLEQSWWSAADEYGVLPLDDRMGERIRSLNPNSDCREYVLLRGSRLMNSVVGPNFSARDFHVVASVARETAGAEGVLLAYGRRASGFSFFVKDNLLWFDYNLAGAHTVVSSSVTVPLGTSSLHLYVAGAAGGHAVCKLAIDYEPVAEAPLPQLMPGGLGCQSTQCGHNAPSAVSSMYEPPFAFTGDLDRVVVKLGSPSQDTSEHDWRAQLAQQ